MQFTGPKSYNVFNLELQYSSVSYSKAKNKTKQKTTPYGDLWKLDSILKSILAKNWVSNG